MMAKNFMLLAWQLSDFEKENLNTIHMNKTSVVEIQFAKIPDDIDFVRQL
jgi:hypothetical protein